MEVPAEAITRRYTEGLEPGVGRGWDGQVLLCHLGQDIRSDIAGDT